MKLVVFDMDGTLIDTHALIAEHMAAAFEGAGLAPPTAFDVRQIIGLSLPIAIARLSGSPDAQLVDALVESYKRHYRASVETHSDREPLFPGTRDVLDRLHGRDDHLLGIATGKGLNGVNRILRSYALGGHFVTLQTPDHNPSKPHPGMLLRAMAETGVSPEDTVMIGDTVFDIETANAAGVASIGVSWGYHLPTDLVGAGANELVDSFADLEAAIDRVLG